MYSTNEFPSFVKRYVGGFCDLRLFNEGDLWTLSGPRRKIQVHAATATEARQKIADKVAVLDDVRKDMRRRAHR